MKRVCVFCGSTNGRGDLYTEPTRELGREMCRRGLGLVFGAGHIGLMGVLADSVLQTGGEAIGVIPRVLVDRELAHEGLTDLRIVTTMHERKALMAELADSFLALPGGFGTADEFFEMLTWTQLKLQAKPIGLLNVNGFFDPLLAWIDRAVAENFIKLRHRQLIRVAATAAEVLDLLAIPC
jgi:uncharacterized protein (TIGR00730 family)